MSLSVIIPSKTTSNLLPCVRAIRAAGETCRIIVVDDGLDRRPEECECIPGIKPFIFSRAVNSGIEAAGTDDVIVLNDDALLRTPGGFSLLASAAAEHPEYGVISATCHNVGNVNQFPRGIGLRTEPRIVCFVACLIPRSTIDLVGMLDERFGAVDSLGRRVYGFEDDDYCYRARRAGLKIGIHDGCLVDHGSLQSTFRASGHCDLTPGRDLFVEKWGAYPL